MTALGYKERCDSCGATKHGPFCSVCGQNERDYSRPFFTLLVDFCKELFSLDAKIPRTLKTMFLKPGELALEYRNNRRSLYITPIRLYLFSSILFFFLVSVTPDLAPRSQSRENRVDMRVDIDVDIRQLDTAKIVDRIKQATDERTAQLAAEILMRPDNAGSKRLFLGVTRNLQDDQALTDTNIRLLPVLVRIAHNPIQMVDDLFENLPLTMLILLPCLVVLLVLFNIGHGIRVVYHLIFALNIHTVAFVVLSLTQLVFEVALSPFSLGTWLDSAISIFSNIIYLSLFVHTYLAYKKFYGTGHVLAVLKFAAISILYQLLIVFALLLLFVYTAFSL